MELVVFERLAALGFDLAPLPNVTGHAVLTREGYAALVPIRDGEFGGAGAPGIVTPDGLAPLVWRGEEAWFVRKGFERRATQGEIVAVQAFLRDVKNSLGR